MMYVKNEKRGDWLCELGMVDTSAKNRHIYIYPHLQNRRESITMPFSVSF